MASWEMSYRGVKPRRDGGGSVFGELHRRLGQGYWMIDIDKIIAAIGENVFEKLSQDDDSVTFAEYRHIHNRKVPSKKDVRMIVIFEYKGDDSDKSKEVLFQNNTQNLILRKMASMLECRLIVVMRVNDKLLEFFEIAPKDGKVFKYKPLVDKDNDALLLDYWNNVLGIRLDN